MLDERKCRMARNHDTHTHTQNIVKKKVEGNEQQQQKQIKKNNSSTRTT